MALFNYATKEITIKIVYYGPGLSGKTTNLQYLHSVFEPGRRGKLLSLATEADRTLFFDFLPVELGKISDFSIRFQLYTVPGQVRYNATRKLVLKGADAVVFVADSQREMREQNIESLKNMRDNLIANNIKPDEIPIILQYNKRDLTNILSVDELNKDLNENRKYEYRESVAINGTGVEDTFQQITKIVIKGIAEKHKIEIQPSEKPAGTVEGKKHFEETETARIFPQQPSPAIPVIETSMYKSSLTEETSYQMPEIKNELFQAVMQEEAPAPKEVIIKEIREVPVIPAEKLDKMVNGITEMAQTLKELKNVVSSIYSEIRDVKREQKEINSALRNITNSLENIKTKRSWFRFS
jgi:signal recognition particle receptor subunit beta